MNRLFLLLLTALFLCACQSLPSLHDRTISQYIPTKHAPRLEQAFHLPQSKYTSQKNKKPITNAAVYILDNAHDAFAARAQLIDNADVSIDAQYYIWRDDVSGNILMQKLLHAAQRGVRVRLLLDDNNTRGMDDVIAVLNDHPNIEIRLFNPFVYRTWRAWGYLYDFPRLNRRMHNKSLTADNRISIIGGRNIADAYFDMNSDTTFADMDVLVSGDIVTQISQDFDRYWQSDSAYPAERIITDPNWKKGTVQLNRHHPNNLKYQNYMHDLNDSAISKELILNQVSFIHTQAQLISDDPNKALNRKIKIDMPAEIQAALGEPKQEIYLVSPYFVPTKAGINMLRHLTENGIKTTILTNSLHATDVAAVHSGYARYRKDLLQAGVQLYEFKASNKPYRQRDKGLTGSSVNSLHAKTFVVDKQRVFVGSFNLDPRSARLNTEMGLVIYHAGLASNIEQQLQEDIKNHAYHLSLNHKNQLQWQEAQSASEPYTHEPQTSIWKRIWTKFLSWLPIERLL